MKLSVPILNTLQIALNIRMEECRKGLVQIVLSEDFKTFDGIDGIMHLSSKKLQKHFSIPAYKAMVSAKNKLNKFPIEHNIDMEFKMFTFLELTQLLKAVGSLTAEHKELVDWLVNALVNNMNLQTKQD